MEQHLHIAGHAVTLRFKRVKNINMRLTPTAAQPTGEVCISAPRHVSVQQIVDFVTAKSDWLAKQQRKLAAHPPPKALVYEEGEMHALWGQAYALQLAYVNRGQGVDFDGTNWRMRVRADASIEKKAALFETAYQNLLVQTARPLMAQWAAIMDVQPQGLKTQKMKSRWGSCHVGKRVIKLNSELARKPMPLLEYVLVHELVHFFERGHNARFYELMSRYLADWQTRKAQLNGLS